MANVIQTQTLFIKKTLAYFENKLWIAKKVYRDAEGEFGPGKSGDTVMIRKPLQFTVNAGAVAVPQDIVDANVALKVDQRYNVATSMTSQEMTLKEDLMDKRIQDQVAIPLANRIEQSVLENYWQIPGWVGTPGEVVNSYADYLVPYTRLTMLGAPMGGMSAAMTPLDYSALAVSNTALLSENAVNPALRDRRVGQLAGTEVGESMLLVRHTVGNYGGTPLVNGASQATTYQQANDNAGQLGPAAGQQALVTDGWTASRTGLLKKGDVFEIAGVFSVNMVTKASTGMLQQFTVVADANSDGSGNATLQITPPIVTTGAYQTVSAAPADNAVITVKGAANGVFAQNIMFARDAIALAMVPLEKPVGANYAVRESYQGFSMRSTADYDATNDVSLLRFDILFGTRVINPMMAIRFSGTP
ncbi:P22 phage major capsid protein family protein [Roseomonas gilardii]|uniref:P22 phage major capsid protein family protein n=1 Tax=Roseomonas gilardii TaxID=257708 RepID=A0ABU3MJR0_9PROT|nr:P22 phage major capsid protein family protein [Roseomonas gilardii]MDT8333002.1 P22 phage major capsid protein family protein [Roseomonas gilardii]